MKSDAYFTLRVVHLNLDAKFSMIKVKWSPPHQNNKLIFKGKIFYLASILKFKMLKLNKM